jgi:hypothetical protein
MFPLMEVPRTVKFTETENKRVAPRAKGGEMENSGVKRTISVLHDGKCFVDE